VFHHHPVPPAQPGDELPADDEGDDRYQPPENGGGVDHHLLPLQGDVLLAAAVGQFDGVVLEQQGFGLGDLFQGDDGGLMGAGLLPGDFVEGQPGGLDF
jgi:hypothetical protein